MQQVKDLKEQIENFSSDTEKMEKKMAKLHAMWHPQIMATIATINENFGMFMLSMKCSGEVELITGDQVCTFNNYYSCFETKTLFY